MALALYLEGVPADLPANPRIRLNQASNDTSQLDVRIGERSYAFTLPPTRTNDRLLAHARQQLQQRKFKRLTEISARLTVDGVDVLPAGAVCRLNSAGTEGGYDVSLYASGIGLGELLAAKTLRGLTTLRPVSVYGKGDLISIINSDSTESDICAPFTAYGNFFSDVGVGPISGTLPPLHYVDWPIQTSDYVLSVWAPNVLEAIFREAGYRIAGAPLRDPYWQTAAIAFTGDKQFPWPWGELGRAELSFDRATPANDVLRNDDCELFSVVRVNYSGPPIGGLTYATHAIVCRYYVPADAMYDLSGTWTYQGNADLTNIHLLALVRPYSENNDAAGTIHVIAPGHNVGVPSVTEDFSTQIPATRGDVIEVLALYNNGSPHYRFDFLNLVILPVLPATLQPADLLPAMTQKEFVKTFLTVTNSTFDVDEARKVVHFSFRDALTPSQLAGALTLDELLDPAGFSYRPAAAFKEVKFSWLPDEKDVVHAIPPPIGLGDGVDFANTTVALPAAGRAEVKEITVPFAASATRRYQVAAVGPVLDTYRYLVCIADKEHLEQPRLDADWSYDYAPRLVLVGELSDAGDQITIGVRDPLVTSYRTGAPYPNWEQIAANRYATTLELLDASELVTTSIHLTPVLYRQLTPGRVVRVNGVVYTVNKLDGYEPGGNQPATLELLRYLPPAGR